MSAFSDFKLDPPVDISDYEQVTISLRTDYMDGTGWLNRGNRYMFEEEVYPKLEEAGYKISDPDPGSCPYICSNEPGNKLNLYLHPQAITGDGKMDDINKIIGVLKGCDTVYDAHLYYHEPVYDIPDYVYHDFLLDHSDEIVECLQNAVLNGEWMHKSEIGFDFARDCRIPRVGDSSGIGFSDVDVQTVRDIYMIAEKNGLLDKEYILEQRNEEEIER